MSFSLRTLLVLFTLSAVVAAALFALPPFVAGVMTFVLIGLVPAGLACGAYFGNPGQRAFCIGALVPTLPNIFFSYFMASPALIVAEEVNWFDPRQKVTTAADAFLIVGQAWTNNGYAMLAVQILIWIAAIVSGVFAVITVRRINQLKQQADA